MSGLPHLSPEHHSRGFSKDASIVLIGALGTGKSTLAVIAQKCFGLLPVDIPSTGQQENNFRLTVAEDALQQHTKGCVIVWPARLLDEFGLLLLKRYSKDHPVSLVASRACSDISRLSIHQPSKASSTWSTESAGHARILSSITSTNSSLEQRPRLDLPRSAHVTSMPLSPLDP